MGVLSRPEQPSRPELGGLRQEVVDVVGKPQLSLREKAELRLIVEKDERFAQLLEESSNLSLSSWTKCPLQHPRILCKNYKFSPRERMIHVDNVGEVAGRGREGRPPPGVYPTLISLLWVLPTQTSGPFVWLCKILRSGGHFSAEQHGLAVLNSRTRSSSRKNPQPGQDRRGRRRMPRPRSATGFCGTRRSSCGG